MKIAILGSGSLAKALGKALTKNRYHVMFGARDEEKARALGAEMEYYGTGGTISSAIHYGEIVMLAVPYRAIEEVLRNPDAFDGKLVVDCTNPVIFNENMAELVLGNDTSAAEQIASMIPKAKVVKAFNTAYAEHIESGPYFGSNDASMFYCGDDEAAKASVSKLIADAGFEPVDAGPLDSARLLEPMAALVIRLGVGMGRGRNIAFKLLQR